jgi:hypothetical protein
VGLTFNLFVFSKAWQLRLARHALFWLLYVGIFQVMDLAHEGFRSTLVALCYLPLNMLFVYVVLYGLVPRLLMRSAYQAFFLFYCVWGLGCLTMDYFWGYFVISRIDPVSDRVPIHDLWRTFTHILDPANFTVANVMAVLAVGIGMYKFWRVEVWQKLQARQEKTQTELELLKTQLQPHFLFNTLNNLYALVMEQSDKAPQMLMQLSAILSYVLYECHEAEVPLEREIDICKDFIGLESQRSGELLEISTAFSGPFAGHLMPPLLFQPFIDGAIMHATASPGDKAWVSIEMSVRHNQLFFRTINSAVTREDPASSGIHNNIRRLQLLYPGQHELIREAGDGVYIVSLTIDLTPAIPDQGSANLKKGQVLYENAVFNY